MKAGCFAIVVSQMYCFSKCSVALPQPWVGLQCVIVVFPDHTHLLFGETFHGHIFNVLICVCLSVQNDNNKMQQTTAKCMKGYKTLLKHV